MTSGHANGEWPPTSCDLQVALQLADSLGRSGQWELVAQYYRWAGAAFVERAEPHNALAIYTLLSQLLPHCLHTHAMIADQYRQLGDLGQASGIYERIAYTHHAAGRMPEAAQVYRIVVDLDPTNVPRRIALAEACISLGYTDEAFTQLETAAAQLKSAGRAGEFLWTAQRMLGLRPADKQTLRDLAEVQLRMGDTYSAVQTLQSLMAVAPRDRVGRELMACAFAAQGQIELACRCAIVLADELRTRGYGSLPDAQRLLGYAAAWNPADPNVRQMYAEVQASLAGEGRPRRGAHVRGEIRATPPPVPRMLRRHRRAPGVPEPIPSRRRASEESDDAQWEDEDTNVLRLNDRRRRRRTISYHQDRDGRVLNFRPAGS
jgi:tetratricopeptide (TPR) repeat protein